MDSVYNLQDLVRCNLCETLVPPLYYDTCHIYICKTCTADHILDESTHHKVVPVQRRNGKSEFPYVQSTPQNNVSSIVNNVTFQYAHIVSLLMIT